jgi:polyhydroxybutyrate depolymerase
VIADSGTTDHFLMRDGGRRRYRVHVPPVVPIGASLVIQLHGGGGNGPGIDRVTRFHHLADSERFVVVSPSGLEQRWNDGRHGVHPRGDAVDDVGFLAAVIDCVAGWLPIDRRRVYVAGISNGAMMAARLAAEIPDRIAAVGQVAGTIAEDGPTWWHPDRPVPIIQFHGTADPILPYAGGAVRMTRRDRVDRGRVLGVDEWAELLTAHNHAIGPLVATLQPDVTIRAWGGATRQNDVEFWCVAGGGHTWPGGPQYLPPAIIGSTTTTFDATAQLWRFFSAHAL